MLVLVNLVCYDLVALVVDLMVLKDVVVELRSVLNIFWVVVVMVSVVVVESPLVCCYHPLELMDPPLPHHMMEVVLRGGLCWDRIHPDHLQLVFWWMTPFLFLLTFVGVWCLFVLLERGVNWSEG